MSDDVWKFSDGVRNVSDGVRKMLERGKEGTRKVLDDVRKVSSYQDWYFKCIDLGLNRYNPVC